MGLPVDCANHRFDTPPEPLASGFHDENEGDHREHRLFVHSVRRNGPASADGRSGRCASIRCRHSIRGSCTRRQSQPQLIPSIVPILKGSGDRWNAQERVINGLQKHGPFHGPEPTGQSRVGQRGPLPGLCNRGASCSHETLFHLLVSIQVDRDGLIRLPRKMLQARSV